MSITNLNADAAKGPIELGQQAPKHQKILQTIVHAMILT